MWSKEMIQEMFPNNRLPSDPNATALSLLYSDYDTVAIQQHKMARNMLVHSEEIVWHDDGRKEERVLYDVYPFLPVDYMPCLNVFGGKMVQNWLQLEEYRDIREQSSEKKEIMNNAGFSYTGL